MGNFAIRCCSIGLLLWVVPGLADWQYQTVTGDGGVPLNVVTAGDPAAPPMLLIHGIGQSHYSFVRQLNSDLAEDFYLVTFDLRGHGASGKPWSKDAYDSHRVWATDVAAVIEATGIEKPIVVGWSYGTIVAMDYVREFGISGLAGINLTGALGALTPFRPPPADDPNAAEFARVRQLQMSPALIDNISATDRMVDWLTEKPIPAEERKRFQAVTLMLPAYARRSMLSRPFDNRNLLASLTLPVLISMGDKDNPVLVEDGGQLAEMHDNIEFALYEGAGHSVFFEASPRFNTELRRFAERVR